MSAATSPGGLKFGAEPKKLILLGLFVLIAIVLWIRAYTSSGDTPTASPPPAVETTSVPKALPIAEAPAAGPLPSRTRRRFQRNNDRGALQMRAIDPTRGDIDPTLRLDLLERLTNVKMAGAGRSLFTMGTHPVVAGTAKPTGPIIAPGKKLDPIPAPVATGPPPPAPITLKFYGFIRPTAPGGAKRGFFLDGDVILVASEGEILKQHYRIVSLKENRATFEDTSNKTQQEVPLTPEARVEN